jgi:hypothetical protein
VVEPWELQTRSDIRKGLSSKYYPDWENMIMALPSNDRIRSKLFPMLMASWDARDSRREFGTAAKSKAALRALKAAIMTLGIDERAIGGCIINRCVDPPEL